VTARPPRRAADLGNLAWPVQTGRLRIRPAPVDDAEAPWGFRCADDGDALVAGV